jgi:GNAT superfamily N-acetyltransferase
MNLKIRPFSPADTQAVLDLWHQASPLDAPLQAEFERKTLLDPNFQPQRFLVADSVEDPEAIPGVEISTQELMGFVCVIIPDRPFGHQAPPKDRAYLQILAVRPGRGHATVTTALLSAAEELAREAGCTELVVHAYPINYYTPGVDIDRSFPIIVSLMTRGYHVTSEALAADVSLARWELDPALNELEATLRDEEKVVVRSARSTDILPLLAFLNQYTPGDWFEDARQRLIAATLGHFQFEAFRLAIHQPTQKVVGYCVHEGEHFGPFGVCPDMEGRGIGTVLLARTLERMRAQHCHCAYVLWAGQRSLEGVYGRMGFKLTRRFAIMRRDLLPQKA